MCMQKRVLTEQGRALARVLGIMRRIGRTSSKDIKRAFDIVRRGLVEGE